MSSQRKHVKSATIKNIPLPLVTSGISTGSASAPASVGGKVEVLPFFHLSSSLLLPILMIKRKMTRTLVEASQVMCGVVIMH